VSTKKELRAEIERLARMVSAQVTARESRETAFYKSVSDANGKTATLILADGTITPVVIGDVQLSRPTPYDLIDVSMTVYPQPPKD